MAKIKLLYFAWVRERVGRAEETIDVPDTVHTVADLLAWLRERAPEYDNAFEQAATIRAAIDQHYVKSDAAIAGAKEIALFPPVTGG